MIPAVTGVPRGELASAARAVARGAIGLLPRRPRTSLRRALGLVAPWEPGAHLRPPPYPPTMEVGPPDFVGVGVQKAGTTWWYELLTHHPRVHNHPAAHKERHYFMRFFDADFGEAEVDEYRRWFPRPPGQLTGEWTPDYMLHFWIPRLLKLAAPETRVLVLVRDPVERIVSGLTHVADRQAVPDARSATEAYLRGRYFDQLQALSSHFGAGQVLVQQFERCLSDPAGELHRTLAFLGLPPTDVGPSERRPVNPTASAKVLLPAGAREELVGLYRPDVEKLAAAYPHLDLALWPNFASLGR